MQVTETKMQVILLALQKLTGTSFYVEYVVKAAYNYHNLADQQKLIAEIKLDYQDNPRMVAELLGDDIIKLLDIKTTAPCKTK